MWTLPWSRRLPRPLRALACRRRAASAWSGSQRSAWEDKPKPVSPDTLAGIPWAGRSTLAFMMQKVSVQGPHDDAVWRRMLRRADAIAHSFTAKHTALMLTAMVRARHRDEKFLNRLTTRFIPSLVPDADLVDMCGIASGLSQLNIYQEATFDLIAERVLEASPVMDAKQISLVANAFVRVGHASDNLLLALVRQVPRRLGQFTAREVAVLLNALSQLPKDAGNLGEELREQLEAISVRLPELLPDADLHSLTLLLNAFSKLNIASKDTLDLLSSELLLDPSRLKRLTPQQLSMVLNAAARLQLLDPRLLDALSSQVRMQARTLDAHAFCVVANAAAKLRLGVETFQALDAQVPRLLQRFSGRQLAMMCHAWAKAHIHNDDLFSLLELPFRKKADELSPHEIALTLYGYAHFRKNPPELFGILLQRLEDCLSGEGVIGDQDLLMIGNALGRVGWCNPVVQDALQRYVSREPNFLYVSPPAISTFKLETHEEERPFPE